MGKIPLGDPLAGVPYFYLGIYRIPAATNDDLPAAVRVLYAVFQDIRNCLRLPFAIAYYPDMVEALEFEVGGYFEGTTRTTIRKNPKGALVHVDYYNGIPDIPPADRQITHLRWMRLVNRLFNELYVHEWKKKYIDPDVLDGTQWSLEISLSGRRKRTVYGSNAFPPYWRELMSLFRPFGKV